MLAYLSNLVISPQCLSAWMLIHFSHVQLCVTLWTVAHQALLSMGFSLQKYWSVLPCPPPRDLPNPGIKPASSASPALQADLLPLCPWWSLYSVLILLKLSVESCSLQSLQTTSSFWSSLFIVFWGSDSHLFVSLCLSCSSRAPSSVELGVYIATLFHTFTPCDYYVLCLEPPCLWDKSWISIFSPDLCSKYSTMTWNSFMCGCMLSCIQLFVTPRVAALQALLSMGFSRQEC